MKILHTGDWHTDKRLAGVPRYDEVAQAAMETVWAAIEHRADLYLHTGDVADPDDGPEVLRALDLVNLCSAILAKHDIRQIWLRGNHDAVEDGTGRSLLTPLNRFYFDTLPVVDHPQVIQFSDNTKRRGEAGDCYGVRLLCLPYCDWTQDEVRVLIEKNDLRKGCTVVATHLQFEGAKLGDETTDMARGRDRQFPWHLCDPSWLVLGGHYHLRQVIQGPNGASASICGSLARLTFGEEKNAPAYSLVEV
jgi:DNA repair exonuclease SbcCD nuclease subunit